MEYDQLKLENQVCFPIYAASRLVTKAYQPLLGELGLTYPQYLVLMVLWERDGIPVSSISESLVLNTNTLTPLLKRMEDTGLVERSRSRDDERVVIISLTEKGQKLRERAAEIPGRLVEGLSGSDIDPDEIRRMTGTLNRLISALR